MKSITLAECPPVEAKKRPPSRTKKTQFSHQALAAMTSMWRAREHRPDIHRRRWRDINHRRRWRVIDGRWRCDIHRLRSERAAHNSSDAKSDEPGPHG